MTARRLAKQRFGDRDRLIGKFAHVYKDGNIDKQVHVGRVIQPGYYVVTFFSWPDGEKTGSEIVNFTDMIDWIFFDDEERWRAVVGEHRSVQRDEGSRVT